MESLRDLSSAVQQDDNVNGDHLDSSIAILQLNPSMRLSSPQQSHRSLSALDTETMQGKIQLVPPLHFQFIHIPKTGGDSFMTDSSEHMPVGTTLKGNKEQAYYPSQNLWAGSNHKSFVFVREPVSHVLSQFMECKYDPWFQNKLKGSGFPGYDDLENAMSGFEEWVRRFASWDGITEGTQTMGSTFAYNCYDPWNMQARYLTAHTSVPHVATQRAHRLPPLEEAQENLRAVDIVGITEYYSPSLCLLEFHALNKTRVSSICRHCDPTTQKLSLVLEKAHHMSHNVPHHSVHMISEETLSLIRKMTTIDQELYTFAQEIFHEEIAQVLNVTHTDLLCRKRPVHKTIEESESSVEATLASQTNSPLMLLALCLLAITTILFRPGRGRRHRAKSFPTNNNNGLNVHPKENTSAPTKSLDLRLHASGY